MNKGLDAEDAEIRGSREIPNETELDRLSGMIIGAAIEVQKSLGPGLLESAYEACLAHELELRGLTCKRQVGLGLIYKGLEVPQAFRMDLVVENLIVVEIKTVEAFLPEHEAQTLSYLRFAHLPLGLLINFRAFPLGKKGIKRFSMTRTFSASSA